MAPITNIENFEITKNFMFFEVTNSQDHPELVLTNREQALHPRILNKLTKGVKYFLQPLRDHLEIPVICLSGFRCPELNQAVGGSKYSQHMKGEAFDITVPGKKPIEIFHIITHELDLKWHQIGIYSCQNFLHFGMATGKDDMQVFKYF